MAETAVMAPYAGGAAPAAQLARVWLTALTVSGDERRAEPDGMPMDIAAARTFLNTQSAALVAIVLGRPFRPRQAAAVGHALVKADFVSADVLGRSLRVLIMRLPELLRQHALALAPAVGGIDGRVGGARGLVVRPARRDRDEQDGPTRQHRGTMHRRRRRDER